MKYDKQLIIETLKKNLEISLGRLFDDIKKLKDENLTEDLEVLRSIKLSDIYNHTSITSPEQCLDELIKQKDLIKNKSISEIQEILRCDLKIISKTLKSLKEKGGLLGYEVKTIGVRRGMKYTMQEVDKNYGKRYSLNTLIKIQPSTPKLANTDILTNSELTRSIVNGDTNKKDDDEEDDDFFKIEKEFNLEDELNDDNEENEEEGE